MNEKCIHQGIKHPSLDNYILCLKPKKFKNQPFWTECNKHRESLRKENINDCFENEKMNKILSKTCDHDEKLVIMMRKY